jgi:hypothetical protein
MLMALAVVSQTALSDDKNRDVVSAEALFSEGRRLMAAGNYEAACPKFADSETLDPAPGTALNLAMCYKKQGKLATAWAAFQSAQTLAVRAGQNDRARAAKNEIAALEPKLSRLTVSVPELAQVPGLEIRCDDGSILRSEWGLPLPRDGGSHEIVASAPNRKEWRTHVELKESGQRLTVEVPKLEDAPSAGPEAGATAAAPGAAVQTTSPSSAPISTPSDAESPPRTPGQAQRVIGLAIGGAGLATLVTGGVLAMIAKSESNRAADEHGIARANDSTDAVHLANSAGVVIGIGAGVAAVGAVVWLTAPRTQTQVGTNGRELFLRGRF